MDKDFVYHRTHQLEILAEILEDIANGKVVMKTKMMSIELIEDKSLNLIKIGEAINLPDMDVAVHMCAGYNPDNLPYAHELLQNELRRIEEWPPNA